MYTATFTAVVAMLCSLHISRVDGKDPCYSKDGMLTGWSGYIRSPSLPSGYYPEEQDCVWFIVVSEGSIISLAVQSFNLEPAGDNGECWDYIEIFDGPDKLSRSFGRYCDVTSPGRIVSSSNTLTLLFHSDASLQNYGFTIMYTGVCSGMLINVSTNIIENKDTNPVSDPTEVTHPIKVTDTTQATTTISPVTSSSRETETSSRVTVTSPELATSQPSNTTLCCNGTDHNDTSQHFNNTTQPDAETTHIASTTTTATTDTTTYFVTTQADDAPMSSGIIESPNYPNQYPSNMTCDWLLYTTPGYKVDIQVVDIELHNSSGCQHDFLQVFDGNDTSNSIYRTCSSDTFSLSSMGEWLYLTFASSDVKGRSNTTGFILQYSTSRFIPCDYEPCQNGAVCSNLFMDYTCACTPGFAGRQCEINIDECEISPCQNQASCIDGVNSYSCICLPGYSGSDCELDIDECKLESTPCYNNGTCIDQINHYTCQCTEEFKGPRCQTPSNIPMCQSEYDFIDGSRLFWNETDGSTSSARPCPPGILGEATRFCTLVSWTPSIAVWSNPDLSKCVSPEFALLRDKVALLAYNISNTDDILEVVAILNNITYSATRGNRDHDKQLYPGDLMVSVDVMETVASLVGMGIEDIDVDALSKDFAESVSNCLDPTTHSVWKNTNSEDVVAINVASIINSTELLAFGIAKSRPTTNITDDGRRRRELGNIPHEEIYSVTTKNLDFEIVVLGSDGQMNDPLQIETSFSYGGLSDSAITLPLEQMKLRNVLETVEFVAIYAAKFPTMGDFFSLFRETDESNQEKLQELVVPDSESVIEVNEIPVRDYVIVNSDVMSVAVLTSSDEQPWRQTLSNPIVIEFKHNENIEPNQRPSCRFMSMQARTITEQWNTDGCQVHTSNVTHTTCHCYHLTNFALIMDIHNIKKTLPSLHDRILSIISYVGCTLSVLGCIMSICVYEFFRLKLDRIRIHENLAVSIALTQIIFLVGVERTENMYVCKTVAALLHYCLTALFMWMMVEGINMYIVLVKVFDRSSNIKKYLAFGWGAPLVIVGVAVGVFHNDYGTGGLCWLPTKTLLVVFAPSAALIIFFNLFVLITVIKVMLNTVVAKTRRQEDELLPIKTGLKATVVLFPLLGLAWVLGFLSVNTDTLVFTYAFVALNSLQGLFFFVAHCALNPDVRKAFERRYGKSTTNRNSLQQLQNSSSSSTSPYTISTQVGKSNAKNRWNVRLTKLHVNSSFANLKDGFDNPVVLNDFAINEPSSSEKDRPYCQKLQGKEMAHYTYSEDEIKSRERVSGPNKSRIEMRYAKEVHASETVLLRDKI